MTTANRKRFLSAALVSAALFTQGAAAEPAPMPETDFTAQWDISGGPEQMQPSRITYSQALGKMRIDMKMEGQAMTMIRDMDSGESLMWSSMMPGTAMRVTTGKGMKLEGEPTGRSDTVNGEACEVWTSSDAEVCITGDGIPVRSVGGGVTATMTQIERGPQDAGSFEAPAGMQVMDMPQGMGGMAPGMPGMQLPF